MSTQTLNTTVIGNVTIEADDALDYAAVSARSRGGAYFTVEPTDGANTFDVTIHHGGIPTAVADITAADLETLHAWVRDARPVGTIAGANGTHLGGLPYEGRKFLGLMLVGPRGASDALVIPAADLPALAQGIFTVAAHAGVTGDWTPAPDTCGVPVFDFQAVATPCDGNAPAGFDRCDEHADAWTR